MDTFDDWSLRRPSRRAKPVGRPHLVSENVHAAGIVPRQEGLSSNSKPCARSPRFISTANFWATSKTGFIPFGFDLTPHLRFGAPNVLAVMCDNRFMKDPQRADAEGHRPETRTAQRRSLAQTFRAGSTRRFPEDVEEIRADQIPWNNPHWHPAARRHLPQRATLRHRSAAHLAAAVQLSANGGPYVYATDISTQVGQDQCGSAGSRMARDSEQNVEPCKRRSSTANGKSVLTLKQQPRSPPAADSGTSTFPARYRESAALGAGLSVSVSRRLLARVAAARRWTRAKIPSAFARCNGTRTRDFSSTAIISNCTAGARSRPTNGPGLGAAQPDWMHFFTLQLMKEAGGNWVRWGHCAGGPAHDRGRRSNSGIMARATRRGRRIRHARRRLETPRFGVSRHDHLLPQHPSILIWEGGNQKVTREHAEELRGLRGQV